MRQGNESDEEKRVFYLLPREAQEFVLRAVFSLSYVQWARYTSELGRVYGPEVERYADETHYAWYYGNVTPSTKTKERLIRIAPKYLSKADKYKLVELIVKPYIIEPSKQTYAVFFDPTLPFEPARQCAWMRAKELAEPFPVEIAPLPSNSLTILKWLHDNDSTAVRAILGIVKSQKQSSVGKQNLASVEPAINRIKEAYDKPEFYGEISTKISLPRGALELNFRRDPPSSGCLPYIIGAVVIIVILNALGS